MLIPPPKSDKTVASNRVIVRLREPSSALGGDIGLIQKQQGDFLNLLRQAKIPHSVQRTFSHVLNAVTLKISKNSTAYTIASLPGVETVSFVRIFNAPEKKPSVFNLATAKAAMVQGLNLKLDLDMTNVTQVHQILNITGTGVKVGIIDSGIDYTHPAFGACSRIGPPCRVAYGYDLVGDDYNGLNDPQPDPDPMDCYGQGTHVAGIVGANDDIALGVAPNVILGAYKISGCFFYTTTDVMIAGMEAALNDSMDIITLSADEGPTWPQDPLALAADAITSKGVIIFSPIGSNGRRNMWGGTAPGLSPSSFGVGYVNNVGYALQGFELSPSGLKIPYFLGTNIPLMDAPLVVSNNYTAAPGDGCQPYPYGKGSYGPYLKKIFLGKIVLIRAGNCSYSTKAINAQNAGAVGVVIYNKYEDLDDFVVSDPKLRIPVAEIPKADGLMLVWLSKSQAQYLQWLPPDETLLVPYPEGGKVGAFTSWGPSPDLSIKPDIVAPGGYIFSTYPMVFGGYATITGTPMASAHAAGIAALYLAAKNRTASSAELKQALQNGAVPVLGGSLKPTTVAAQGAGILNAINSILSSTLVSPATLRLGFSNQTTAKLSQTLSITNQGPVAMVYTVSHVPASTANVTQAFDTRYSPASTDVTFNRSSFILSPFQSLDILVSFNFGPPGLPQLLFLSGYIKISPALQDPKYTPVHVPYAVLWGDPDAFVVQFRGDNILPFLKTPDRQILTQPNETAVFTFATPQDVPMFVMLTQRPAYAVSLELYENNTNTFLGYVANLQYLAVAFTSVQWLPPDRIPAVKKDASNDSAWVPVPDGTYYVNMSTFALPEINKTPEVWRSPMIVIKTK